MSIVTENRSQLIKLSVKVTSVALSLRSCQCRHEEKVYNPNRTTFHSFHAGAFIITYCTSVAKLFIDECSALVLRASSLRLTLPFIFNNHCLTPVFFGWIPHTTWRARVLLWPFFLHCWQDSTMNKASIVALMLALASPTVSAGLLKVTPAYHPTMHLPTLRSRVGIFGLFDAMLH